MSIFFWTSYFKTLRIFIFVPDISVAIVQFQSKFVFPDEKRAAKRLAKQDESRVKF